jgi:predicted nucleic-acid-binding protein
VQFFDEALLDDFEDLMVLHSALRNGCSTLITRDKKMLQLQNFYDMAIKLPG